MADGRGFRCHLEIFSDPDVLDPELWNQSGIIFEASVRLSWIHHEGQEFTLKSVWSVPEIFLSLPGTVESGTMSLLLSDGSPVFFRVTESGKNGFCRFEALSQMFKGLKPLQDSLGPDRPGPCEQTGVSLCQPRPSRSRLSMIAGLSTSCSSIARVASSSMGRMSR